MINHIRKQVQQQPELADTKTFSLTGQEAFWDDDSLLQPVLEEDALLHGNAGEMNMDHCTLLTSC
jgi:protein arginine N-methyltransferase 3